MFTVGPVAENCFVLRRDGADRALIVDPGDEAGLAAAAAEATHLDPDDCRREAARRFTPSRMAERYLRLYDKVLTRSGRPRVHEAVRSGASGA